MLDIRNGEEYLIDHEEKLICEENEFTHEKDNVYTQSKNLGSTTSLFSSAVESQESTKKHS